MTAGIDTLQADRKPYALTGADHDFPPREGPPERTILLCTHPRSGSSLLGEALYFAGALGCPLEYFHHGFRPGFAKRWRTLDLAGYTAALHRWRTDRYGIFSAKLFWPDLAALAAERDPARFAGLPMARPHAVSSDLYRALAASLADIFPNPCFLHLERRDRVRQAVSAAMAKDTGQFRVIPGIHPLKDGPTRALYDFGRIDSLIALSDWCHAHWRNLFAALEVAPIAVSYEALASDYGGSVGRVLTQLGRDVPPPVARLERQGGAANEAWVLRYLRDNRARST